MSKAVYEAIDADLDVTSNINPDVNQEWNPLGIMLGEKVAVKPAHKIT